MPQEREKSGKILTEPCNYDYPTTNVCNICLSFPTAGSSPRLNASLSETISFYNVQPLCD